MKAFDFCWDRGSISNFWDMYSEVMPEGYFSKKFGNDILRIAKKNLGFQGRILDFGCGPGFLLNKLVNIPNSKLYGVDASEENVLMTRQRLGGYKNFCFAELISESFFAKNHSAFDCVFLIECLEHILPEENQKFFHRISALVAPQGKIIITVPNKEDFEKSKCVCPNCGAVFHKYQHMTQWNSETIINFANLAGFKCLACKETAFTGFRFLNFPFALAHKFYYGYKPNLIYIGQKL